MLRTADIYVLTETGFRVSERAAAQYARVMSLAGKGQQLWIAQNDRYLASQVKYVRRDEVAIARAASWATRSVGQIGQDWQLRLA